MGTVVLLLVCFSLLVSARAILRLVGDWIRMQTAVRFVQESYRHLKELPSEAELEQHPRAPIFLHLVPAYQEPEIAGTVKAMLASRYARAKLHVVVITKEEEEQAPHISMSMSTGELVRRLRNTLSLSQQQQVHILTMPGPGRKPHQLNWALRPETLREILGDHVDSASVFVGVSDADSQPHPDTFRWIAHRQLTGRGDLAYQGVTLSLANYGALDTFGKISAIQQSSVFLRISIPRLLTELGRMRLFSHLCARFPRVGSAVRPIFDGFLRRSHILLGHNQFVRLDTLLSLGGFPLSGATEDSTLGYALGLHGIPIHPMPMVELCELPETSEKVVQQNARWYKGVLDDSVFLWRCWRNDPSLFNLAQLVRHTSSKAVEWPIAAFLYPGAGLLGGTLWRFFPEVPTLLALSPVLPTLSLLLSICVGGVITHASIQDLLPCFPFVVDLRRKGFKERFLGIFRCHRYWLLATRSSWRVLGSLLRTGQYEPRKTDRVIRQAPAPTPRAAWQPRLGIPEGLSKASPQTNLYQE
jgi:hypothetical protein